MKAFGLGRVGRDVELRYTPDGSAVANVSLAFNWGKKGDDGKRSTTWVDAALWNKQAEALAAHLIKGTAVAVTLSDVHIETFQARDGTPGSKIVARVDSLEFAGGGQQQGAAPAQAPARAPAPAPRPAAPKTATGFDDMDDDIPF